MFAFLTPRLITSMHESVQDAVKFMLTMEKAYYHQMVTAGSPASF